MSDKPKCSLDEKCPEHRKPLLEFLVCLLDQDIDTLFRALDVAHHALIYDNSDERFIMDEFMVTLFIAAKANKILK